MTKRLIAVSLMLVLALGIGIALKASTQSATKSAVTAYEFSDDVLTLKVKNIKVEKGKKYDMGAQTGFYLNVMQDCWTTDTEEYLIDPEMENYILTMDDVVFVWKHKIFEGCENYLATVVGLPCQSGKPPVAGRVAWVVPNIQYGYLEPGFEYILSVTVTNIPPGRWDWFVVTECFDTNGRITPPLKDGDIDDVIGANLGIVSYPPLVYGPEPVEVLDPDPGGVPPGRLAGEEGACRCWCFTVEQGGSCPPVVGDWIVYYDWGCDGGPGNHDMTFYADGTWYSSEGYRGTWAQDGCDVEWWYESGTHYWGVMNPDGLYMEGDMLSYSGMDGCWWADRTSVNAPGFGGFPGEDGLSSSGEIPATK